jgi:predicted secreted Zn-dependent protease
VKIRASLILFFILVATAAGADEIVLKSGKSLTGRITAETDQSYTIKLGANMFISVEKDEVSRVSVTKPATGARPVYRMETPAAQKTPAVSTTTSTPSAVSNPREFISTETFKTGVVVVEKATRFKTYSVEGKDFAAVRRAILDPASGKGFPDGGKRRVSRTEWSASWTGQPGEGGKEWKSVVVVATVTVSLPAWKAKGTVVPEDAAKWAALLKEATARESGHMEIIHDGLVSFGQSASNFSAIDEGELKSETTALFNAIQQQVTKRRLGYERRERRAPLPVKKKT